MNRPRTIDELYPHLFSIGIRVNSPIKVLAQSDIEETLVDSLYFIDRDSRLLGLILSWMKVHHLKINADKFFRTYEKKEERNPWFSGVCSYLLRELKDHRFKKGVSKNRKTHDWMNRDQSSLIKMKGPCAFLESEKISIASTSVRIRESDIFEPKELCGVHNQYRNRCLYGANWRSDIITFYQINPTTIYKISKDMGIRWNVVNSVISDYRTAVG